MKSKSILLLMAIALFGTSALAQDHLGQHQRFMQLDSLLELTAEQKQHMKEVREEYRIKYKELGEERKKMRKAEMQAMQEILTTEQSEKLELYKLEQRKKIESQRKQKRTLFKEDIKPALKAYRLELEEELNEEEKERIEAARAIQADLRQLRKESMRQREDDESTSDEQRAQIRQKQKQIADILEPVLNNHKSFLLRVKDHMEPEHSKTEERRPDMHHRIEARHQSDRRAYQFLLMKV